MTLLKSILIPVSICFLISYIFCIPQADANIVTNDQNQEIETLLENSAQNTPALNGNDNNSRKTQQALEWLKKFKNDGRNANDQFARIQKKAIQGDTQAQVIVGHMYATGRGIPKDFNQAMVWFKKSANSGNAWAQTILGSIYRAGKYLAKDIDTAKYWYTKAANQGSKRAKQYLDNLVGD